MHGPKFVLLFEPLLKAISLLGGSARPAQLFDEVAALAKVSEEDRAVVMKSGGLRFNNQVYWAKFYLSKAGLVTVSGQGVWSLTEKAEITTITSHEDAMAIFNSIQSQFKPIKPTGGAKTDPANKHVDKTESDEDPGDLPAPANSSPDLDYKS